MDQTDALLHAQPGLLKTLSLSALVILLVFTVLRPMSRHMMTALSQTPARALPASTAATSGTARQAAGSPGVRTFAPAAATPGLGSFLGAPRPTDTQTVFEHVSEQIRREPAQSTRLLESWIGAPVEDDE